MGPWAAAYRRVCDEPSPLGRSREIIMFLALFFVFLVCWIFGWVVFHVAGGLIHALLVVAVISLVWHFVRDRGAV
jgi:hypothetical protein